MDLWDETHKDPQKRLLSLADPFEILDVTPEDTDETVRQAFLRLVRRYPPERAPAVYQHCRDAYEAVRDQTRRRARTLTGSEPPPSAPLVHALWDQRASKRRLEPEDLSRLFRAEP